MASREYWQNRFIQLEQAQLNRGARYFHDLERHYNRAAREVDKELAKWYTRLAVNNELSITEAKKMLTSRELEEFRWDVEEYIEKGRTLNYSNQWARQLENASARVHISRLEAIKLQMQQQVEVLYGNELDSFDSMMRDIYTESYYRTAYEIQKGVGVGSDLMQLDTRKIDKVMSRPWAADGSNFSSRIWKQKTQLVNELNNHLTQSFIRGLSPEAATKAIEERFNVSKGQAGRLVMTEAAFIHSAGQRDMFHELGVEEYEIVATLDTKTSEICRNLDGTHHPMSEYQAGVTAPPFHCWCRTTTVPYYDDEFTEDEVRAARGDDGKTYYVPSNMTYHEWKEAFVDGGSKGGLIEVADAIEELAENVIIIAEGKNLVGEWQPSGEYEHVIDDIVHTQGYDGVPQVVGADEFEEAMKKSNFYAERTYAANTQEQLDEWRNELYTGEWYINCTEGGAQYGQGMYCAASYDISDLDSMNGIGLEMIDYKKVNADKGNNFSYTEGITLQPDARILELPHNAKAEEYISEVYRNEYVRKFATQEQRAQVDRYIELNETINNLSYDADTDYIDELYTKRAESTVGIEQLIKDSLTALEDTSDGRKYHGLKNPGVLAAEMGYDAINAVGHGKSGSYTVILNRTKVIFRSGGVVDE